MSYVILNGSTWGLEVKGVGRERRDVQEVGSKRFSFIDTRNIPMRLEKFLTALYTPELDLKNTSDDRISDEINCAETNIDYENCLYLDDDAYFDDDVETRFDGNDLLSPAPTANEITYTQQGILLSTEATLRELFHKNSVENVSRKELVQKLMQLSINREAENNITRPTTEPPAASLHTLSLRNIIRQLFSPSPSVVDIQSSSQTKSQRIKAQPGTFTTRLFDEQPSIFVESTTLQTTSNMINSMAKVTNGEILKVDQDYSPGSSRMNAQMKPSSESSEATVFEIIMVSRKLRNIILSLIIISHIADV